jgi:hypothetical protein
MHIQYCEVTSKLSMTIPLQYSNRNGQILLGDLAKVNPKTYSVVYWVIREIIMKCFACQEEWYDEQSNNLALNQVTAILFCSNQSFSQDEQLKLHW